MNKIENVILLLLSIICYIAAIVFTHEFVIIQKDFLMLIPVIIFAVLATFTLIFFLLCVIRGKTEYQLVDNKILVKRRKKIIFTIDVIKIDEIIKYMNSFKDKTHFIKFNYENKKYRIDIDNNPEFLKICDGKKIIEKVDYSLLIEFILGIFQGL